MSQCVRVLDTPDLDRDGRSDVLLTFPATCDDDGACEFAAAVRREGGSFLVVMPANRLWDLTVEGDGAGKWRDLREAQLAEGAGASVVALLWRFDGERYSVVPGSRALLVDEP